MWLISEMLIKFTCGLIIIHFTKITSVKFFEKCLSTKSYRNFQVADGPYPSTNEIAGGGVESEVGTQASSLLCVSISLSAYSIASAQLH